MAKVTLDRPWLSLEFAQPLRVLSWSLNQPGFVTTAGIIWREVRNADLPEDFDVDPWLHRELMQHGMQDRVAFLTSRDVTRYHQAKVHVGKTTAFALATVGLSNAERVGLRQPVRRPPMGTINVAIEVSDGLTDAAMLEALSIATQARTAAVIDTDIRIGDTIVTGTGTDCLAVAAPQGATRFSGLHTELGEAIGRAVYDAVRTGAEEWKRETD